MTPPVGKLEQISGAYEEVNCITGRSSSCSMDRKGMNT